MTSPEATVSSESYSKFDECRWVSQIRRAIEEDLEDYDEVPVCIFNVPKALLATDPQSYTPQEVSLGPYHYWRPELHEMERYKLAAAKRIHTQLQSHEFHNLVDQLTKLEGRIRACYHKFLDFKGETLAWMMAVDASFLVEFLQVYAIKEGKMLSKVSSRMSHLLDYGGTKSAHNAILRDMVMLENQIPLFVLRKLLESRPPLSADDILLSMLMGLCKELSPLKLMEDPTKIQVSECSHLLDFLYHMIVPQTQEPSVTIEVEVEDQSEGIKGEEKSSADPSNVKQFLEEIWKVLSKLNRGPIKLIKKVRVSSAIKVILKLPWTILSKLPVFTILKEPLEYFVSVQETEAEAASETSSSNSNNKPPLVEEITIPSVTELLNSGVRFLPTKGSILTIAFDPKTFTFSLPTITLDVNTEVILRNLLAYETSKAWGPLIFARYTELMNGIIDTDEDVKALRERGIILNHLKSDGEAANLWNGMSRSISLTKVPFLDKAIEDVNKYQNSKWKVKVGKFMNIYVFGSWKFLTFFAAIALMLLMTLQSFCSVYRCPRTLETG